MNLKNAFNTTQTTNGDKAYISTLDNYLDVLFKTEYYTKNINSIPQFLNPKSEYDKLFARMVRDPRTAMGGLGKRDLGINLMEQANVSAVDVYISGRADDVFKMGYDMYEYRKSTKGGEYWKWLFKVLVEKEKDIKSGKEIDPVKAMVYHNVTKWLPRLNKKDRTKAKAFRDCFGLTNHQYQKLIANHNTVEAVLCRGEKVENYETVPSLARLKHKTEFSKDPAYQIYMDKVQDGEAKIAVGTMSVFDIAKNYYNKKITAQEADIFFNNLKKAELGKMIAIVDNSGSMYDGNSSYLKARAVGHYIAKNSNYMTNHVIAFSNRSQLIALGKNYKTDMNRLDSFNDISNTNFGKTMETLSKVTKDLPDWIVVLSDMQFDEGSSQSKDQAMKILRQYNPNIKIVWWNFASNYATTPETDRYGNVFLSGYNANLLSLLEVGFDGKKLLNKMIENYKSNIEKL